jgi:DNA phosphorothioation-dependent restriction protein DptG
MIEFKLDTAGINNTFFKNGKIKHKTGLKLKLLPFPANASKIKEVLNDLKDFKGVAGTCFRACLGLSQNKPFDKQAFLDAVCLKANASGNINLIDLVDKVAFNDGGQLVLFDPLVYPYVRNLSGDDNPTLSNLGKFIFSNFFDSESKDALKALSAKDPDNLFYKLILSCIPSPEKDNELPESYYKASFAIVSHFQADLKVMLQDQEFFIAGFHQLLKFYFLQYVICLCLELNELFSDKPIRLFFSVKWEKLQSHRSPVIHGWDLFKSTIDSLFTHSVTIELLNYIEGFEIKPFTYSGLKIALTSLTSEEKTSLLLSVQELSALYKSSIKDVKWDKLNQNNNIDESDPVLREIIYLNRLVEFQFNETTRKRARDAYNGWVEEFTKENFLKRRGQLGYSLNLDQDLILLLTRLCVGEDEKIRLNNLWSALETRGVFLDNPTRESIIQYFDRINLLEKKSDSGDAQYVRKFSQLLV